MTKDQLFDKLVRKRWMVIKPNDPRRRMAERLVKERCAEWLGKTRTRLSATCPF